MTAALPSSADVLEQAPDAIVLVDDATGVIVYANQRVAHLFGLTPANLLGQPIETLIPERLRGVHAAHREGFTNSPKVRPMGRDGLALVGRRADGSEFPVDIHLAPILNDGCRWTLAAIRDATERHRFLDELRSAKQMAEHIARMKGEFLAVAAHDLSQPAQNLELVIGVIERSVQAGSEIAELTKSASGSLARMRELLRMLIEISRLESGTMRIVEQPICVTEIFGELERQFAPLAQSKALRFGTEACPNIVETDPALLRSMLANLVGNAIRYTPQGEVRILCIAPADGSIRLAVTDTGIGIPSDQLQRIFDDFQRLDEARNLHQEGFGLGLGIVRRLSRLLGFSVTVESTIGHGSTFDVHIPANRVHRAA